MTLTFADEVDCSRGDVIAAAHRRRKSPISSKRRWCGWTTPKCCPAVRTVSNAARSTATATITKPKYEVDVNSMAHVAADTLALNAIGVCNLSLDRPIPFESYEDDHDLGGFILIDRITNRTVAAGMIHFALRRSHNIHWQSIDIGRESHARAKEPETGGAVVHRIVGLRQIDDRQSGRTQTVRARQAQLPARRRQYPSRPQPRSRLHRCRPRGEYPPRRRSRQADDERGTDRAHRVHLAVPLRAPDGAPAVCTMATSSKSSSTRRCRSPKNATRKGYTKKRARDN